MKASITITTGVKINIYQIISMEEKDDKIILYGNTFKPEEMIIGFDDLPGTPIGAQVLTLYKPMIANIKFH